MNVEKLIRYIIDTNREAVMAFLIQKGITATGTDNQLYQSCLDYIQKNDDPAIAEFLKLHPDYDLIASQVKTKSVSKTQKSAKPKTDEYYELELPMPRLNLPMLLEFLGFLVLVSLVIKIFKE